MSNGSRLQHAMEFLIRTADPLEREIIARFDQDTRVKHQLRMPRPIPFYFCRYTLSVEGEPLDANAQLASIQELQGQYFGHGTNNIILGIHDTVLMRPREFDVGGHRAFAWSVGKRAGLRSQASYDEARDQLNFADVNDPGITYADFVALPHIGVLAVDDRVGNLHLGGKPAIARFRSIFQNIPGGAVDIELVTRPQDVERAMARWNLTEFSFVVRPFNPHPPGDLSERLSEALSADRVAKLSAKVQPAEGQYLAVNDGQIAAAKELADAGYGQYSFKGVTRDGHTAEIKRPVFNERREKNQRRQAEPRELRIVIDTEGDYDNLIHAVADAMIDFYRDE